MHTKMPCPFTEGNDTTAITTNDDLWHQHAGIWGFQVQQASAMAKANQQHPTRRWIWMMAEHQELAAGDLIPLKTQRLATPGR